MATNSADDAAAAFHPTGYQVAGLIYVLITTLIVVTIVFEMVKDWMIESSSKYTRQITQQIIAEMVLIGFLSLVVFIFIETGAIEEWSVDVFGSSAPSYIESRVTDAEFSLFLVLIFIAIQGKYIAEIGDYYAEQYEHYNLICQKKTLMAPFLKEMEDRPNVSYASWVCDYLSNPIAAWNTHSRRVETEEIIIFYCLREEAILRRSPLPPYKPARKDRQLPANFDYGSYMSLCMSKFLTEIVTLTPGTLAAMLLFLALVYGVVVACGADYLAVAIIWVIAGYLGLALLTVLEGVCNSLLQLTLNPAHLHVEPGVEGIEGIDEMDDTWAQSNSNGMGSGSEDSDSDERNYAQQGLEKQNGGAQRPRLARIIAAIRGTNCCRPDVNSTRAPKASSTKEPKSSSSHDPQLSRETTGSESFIRAKRDHSSLSSSLLYTAAPTQSMRKRRQSMRRKNALFTLGAEDDNDVDDMAHKDGEIRPAMFPDWNHMLDEAGGQVKGSVADTAGFLERLIVDDIPPNIQEKLFFGGKLGPILNIFCVRFHLVSQALYLMVVVVFFAPYMFDNYGWKWGLLYLLVALLPPVIQYMGFYGRMIHQMVLISSCGCLVDGPAEREVQKLQRMQQVIRLMLLLTKVSQQKKMRAKDDGVSSTSGSSKDIYSEDLDPALKAEIAEVARIFDKYDRNGDGELDLDEMRPLLGSLGLSLDEYGLEKLFIIIDSDGSGTCSKDELLAWRLEKFYEDNPEEMAKNLFLMFVDSIEEDMPVRRFKKVLLSFNDPPYDAKLSKEEVHMIVDEFDEDGSGYISFDEFLRAIKLAREMD